MLTPRGRLREPSQIGALAVVALAATLLLLFAAGHRDGLKTEPAAAAAAVTWTGLVGEGRPKVDVSRLAIVVLKAPSLAQRVAAAGGAASEEQERRWTTEAENAQKQLLARVALQGVRIGTEFTFTRVLNGFSAQLDPQAAALLDRAPEVAGIYPVRVGYPATIAQKDVREAMRRAGAAARPAGLTLPGFTGRGVTVALLDTGVDQRHAYLRRSVEPGTDIVSGAGTATAKANPDDPADVERHGTEMAGVIAGHGGPYGLRGIAPGATIYPIRVAGWQHDANGGWAVYARSDQLIAGLEAAVDPNGDGDTHDAARIAVVGLAEPYVSFADAPESRAVGGALDLDTLVVAPAGNDLPAGPAFGSISGPGGAPGALTVGAADLRSETEQVRVAVRSGLDIQLSRPLPLAGAFAPEGTLQLEVAAPRFDTTSSAPVALRDFFDDSGRSMVAGRAALVPAGASSEVAVESAARAGAYTVLLYGRGLPAGALGLDENVVVPVVVFPQKDAERMLAAMSSGKRVSVSLGLPRAAPNAEGRRIADFSSSGLSYNGAVKPELAAPGVTIPTAEPGTNEDGTPRFGTVNGTSVAAAGIGGAAALLAQARPALGARDLLGLLTGTAHSLQGEPTEAQGAGLADLGKAAAAELSAQPATIAIPPFASRGRVIRRISIHNVSTRTLRLRVSGEVSGEVLSLSASPRRLVIGPGRFASVRITVRAAHRLPRPVSGSITIVPESGQAIHVPWVAAPQPRGSLLGRAKLSPAAFKPAETFAVLTLDRVGRLGLGDRPYIEPVSRIEIALWTKQGKRLGLLARLRDQLYGSYTFGITGRAPTGQILAPGVYRLVVRAYSTAPGPPSRKVLTLRIER
jgi:Subtilase family/Peptidase inhibitor I9